MSTAKKKRRKAPARKKVRKKVARKAPRKKAAPRKKKAASKPSRKILSPKLEAKYRLMAAHIVAGMNHREAYAAARNIPQDQIDKRCSDAAYEITKKPEFANILLEELQQALETARSRQEDVLKHWLMLRQAHPFMFLEMRERAQTDAEGNVLTGPDGNPLTQQYVGLRSDLEGLPQEMLACIKGIRCSNGEITSFTLGDSDKANEMLARYHGMLIERRVEENPDELKERLRDRWQRMGIDLPQLSGKSANGIPKPKRTH